MNPELLIGMNRERFEWSKIGETVDPKPLAGYAPPLDVVAVGERVADR